MHALDALLDGILDYAGLFPPASLDLATALKNFKRYRSHPQARILGRFVLPVNLLDTLAEDDLPARITLLVKDENVVLPELPVQVNSIEVAHGQIAGDAQGRFVFHELDCRGEFAEAMEPLQGQPQTGVKLRTGGVTPEDVPPAEAIARFLVEAARRDLPVKFTAGLHGPLPNDDPRVGARMHGFLNVFTAAFAAYSGEDDAARLAGLLRDAGAGEFCLSATHLDVAGYRFSAGDIARLRSERVISFGSCSFLEPVQHLRELGWLG